MFSQDTEYELFTTMSDKFYSNLIYTCVFKINQQINNFNLEF